MKLADLTTVALSEWLARGPLVALLPVGSVEPHGPHLPLATDTLISEAAIAEALERLAAQGIDAVVAPAIPYGVTEYARGFAGAVSIDAATLTAFVRNVVAALLREGLTHVCIVNNHLEPEHDAALRAALVGLEGRATLACPLTRRWGRTLSAEYKSGACHAGRYETSLVLAAAPELVDTEASLGLPPLATSLSEGIRAGKRTFAEMGLEAAYTGAPAEATVEEGRELVSRLAEMVTTEVVEALAAWKSASATTASSATD
ncbi:MAG: creatininase family protein [Deltaproteobacteria bacterium]|nr:creatininase family protein [Deltaproteobacteria bacterium]